MKIKVNENFAALKESYLFSEIGKKVKAYKEANPDKKVIRLGIGDVTLPLAPVVIRAMEKAVAEMGVKETFRGYPPEYGHDFLREAIAAYYKRKGVSVQAGDVFVSDGAKSDVGNIVDILGKNTILIPSPVYPVYMDSNVMSGNKIELLEAGEADGFLGAPDVLDGETYVIYICSPNNPTGATYDRAGLKAWVDYALASGSLIIFDSAYEAFIHGDYPHSIYEIEGAEKCAIEICSFSKTAGFTGTRCAWTVVPAALETESGFSLKKLWARRQATKFNGVSYPVQRGAEAALSEEGVKECSALVEYYMENARLISSCLKGKGVWHTGGVCSPYIWLKCPNGLSGWEFFDLLLEKVQVVGTPGEGFGDAGAGYFRLTAFGSREDTEEAVARLKTIL
ncbi:MAG: LL-diaminopimelate aminotransferase [Clostridia bacterium]|nr:LL-diaminopimelate aminotransferase [Clostridia bacterium]